LEQSSPRAFDAVVYNDLQNAYNQSLDQQLISGTGASGQLLGILGVAGTQAIAYTDATPTAAELIVKLGDASRQVAENRGLIPDTMLLAPRRWYWLNAQTDAQARPLGEPEEPLEPGMAPGVGSWAGLPIWADSNVPITRGAGTNEDVAIITRAADHFCWESTPQARVLTGPQSGVLGVRIQLWSYVAATSGRQPTATSIVSGTGLVPPVW